MLLSGQLGAGDTVRVDADDDGLVLSVVDEKRDGSVSEGSLSAQDIDSAASEADDEENTKE